MGAYPFPYRAPGLTFRQFVSILDKKNLASVARIEDPFGAGVEALYRLTRNHEGQIYDFIEFVEDDTWPMMGSTFRRFCDRLKIDPDLIIGTRH